MILNNNEFDVDFQFKPIFSLKTWKKIGSEVFYKSHNYVQDQTFNSNKHLLNRLDELSPLYRAILFNHKSLLSNKKEKLFVNTSASNIFKEDFTNLLFNMITDCNLDNNQIVLEFSESENINNYSNFIHKVYKLKEDNFSIAIPNFGIGYSDFKSVIEIDPDYLKLDKYFTFNLHLSKKKQYIISTLLNYCNNNAIELIIDGLEDEKDLAIAKFIGINFGQGNILEVPSLAHK